MAQPPSVQAAMRNRAMRDMRFMRSGLQPGASAPGLTAEIGISPLGVERLGKTPMSAARFGTCRPMQPARASPAPTLSDSR